MNKIEIIPLGGIGEFGMNCMGMRYGDEMIILDAGMGFPEETPFGVDVCIPNFDFLEEYRDDMTAIVLTHGHEDHLGRLPYILKKFNVPVYVHTSPLALAEKRLEEHRHARRRAASSRRGERCRRDRHFKVEFIHVSHSLVDCFSLAIHTPVGTIIHTGDYKIDDTPVIGHAVRSENARTNMATQAFWLCWADSTNATVPGRTPSEQAVIPAFEEIFEETKGRLFVATFSSSIHRLQIVFDVAQEFGRKVCVLGRSMQKNVEIAEEPGF